MPTPTRARPDAVDLPPISWFRNPGLTELTPLTVEPEGRVFGHLAGWGQAHRGMPGQNIQAPRSRTGYAEFMTGSTEVLDGQRRRVISSGNLTVGAGHADTSLSADATRNHYDSSTSIVATVAAGEDARGIWVAGALMPDVDEFTLRRFRACSLSGDWRRVGNRPGLELVAALAVPVPGYSVARTRVASGAPLSLVAAGALAPTMEQQHAGLLAELDDSLDAQLDRLLRELG